MAKMPGKNRFRGATVALAALGVAAFAAPSAAATASAAKMPGDGGDTAVLARRAAFLTTAFPLARAASLPGIVPAARRGIERLSAHLGSALGNPRIDATATGSVASSFFATVAIPFSPIGPGDDWKRVRSAGPVSASTQCRTLACETRLETARATIAEKSGAGFLARLGAVNALVNRSITYAPDSRVYGTLDHWASGAETMRVGAGDCEDFAILKMSLLREMGVPSRSMSLVVLRDTARDLYHAVLAVSTNRGHYILDNVRDEVYRDVAVSHYMPLYSFSDDRSWIHGKPSGEHVASAPAGITLGSIAPGESGTATGELTGLWTGTDGDALPTDAL
ncbi:transglutaminase-like cysteine peptidase [Oricola thermophila]|uniref:Transglutaminase-like cysteine peptidase n=1 Tax=Oricola thermophila TaxID=2742145 RepID=A0A6N1VBV9_9HYPH|nr:transglutaminase-like cysteine peptidase [Oricola thermophila]QKV16985.1 transglutaminase-like cysteine peptidase [Oricola thermophila]